MEPAGEPVTVLISRKVRGRRRAPKKMRYDAAQVERMRRAHEIYEETGSFIAVGRELGVSNSRAREILDRGAALGLYPDRTRRAGVPSASPIKVLGPAPIDELRAELRRQARLLEELRREVDELRAARLPQAGA